MEKEERENQVSVLSEYKDLLPPYQEIAREAVVSPSTVASFFYGNSANKQVREVVRRHFMKKFPQQLPHNIQKMFDQWKEK